MRLEIGTFPVSEIAFGQQTALDGHRLIVGRDELIGRLAVDRRLKAVQVDLARPGEDVRIIHVMDAVEPRHKVAGPGVAFPGFLGPTAPVGEGRTHRLQGMAVLGTGSIPGAHGGLSIKESIVDMSGPAAPYSFFSRIQNLVLGLSTAEGLSIEEASAAVRLAILRAAAYLASATEGRAPASVQRYELGPAARDLPRVAYICQIMTEGSVHQSFVYGRTVDGMLPVVMHPNEFMDGAIVTGDYHIASIRNPTYFYQNNAAIEELYRRHGRDLAFVGTVVAKTMAWEFEEKERIAHFAAKTVRLLGAQGALLSFDNGGHAVADLMLMCQKCEEQGLKTALVLFEMAEAEGRDLGFVAMVKEADAIVSTGNMDAMIDLPPVGKVLGGDQILDFNRYEGGEYGDPSRGFRTAIRRLYAATTPVGAERLTTVAR